MQESKPITDKFILDFLLEAQHRSGLPAVNPISAHYATNISRVNIPDELLEYLFTSLIDNYMVLVHKMYRYNKTWRDCDW